MNRLRGRLTYANVISTLCLVLLLGGGSAYAASQVLPKDSVGAKQLKKGAVTPVKLSPAARATMTGARGPQGEPGPTGATGPQGPEGKVGPQGPGAVTVDQAVPTVGFATQLLLDGVEVRTICQSGLTPEIVLRGVAGALVEGFGTENSYISGAGIFPVDFKTESVIFAGGGPSHIIDLDLLVRAPATSAAFTRLDLHLEYPTCRLLGTYTPSTGG